MTYHFIVLLLSTFFYSFSQKDSIIIKGTVITDSDYKKIQNAYVHLVSSQNHRYEYKTDSSGNYRFRFFTDAVFSCTITVASDKHTSARRFRNLGFLATKNNAVFELVPGKIYNKDFELREIISCGPIAPAILFNPNSILSCNDSIRNVDSVNFESFYNTIQILYFSLKENPTIIIEIIGNASSHEKNAQNLSLYRAQLIKEILIAKGINRNRLLIKSLGNKRLLIKDNIIKKAKTKEEKLALHMRNQRVVFRIISWDFKE